MPTRTSSVICVTACAAAFLLAPLRNAWGAKPVFNTSELQQLDQALDSLEKQNAEKVQTVAPANLSSLLAEKGVIIAKALISPQQGPADLDLTEQERGYYKQHQHEFRVRVLNKELGPTRMERMRKIFKNRFDNRNRFVKREAMWWFLAMIGDQGAVAEVEALLKSQDAETRFEAANQLTFIGNSAGSKLLEDALRSRDKYKSRNAAIALARLGSPQAKEKLVQIIRSTTSSSVDDRSLAVSGLESFKGNDVDELIVEQLDSKDIEVAQAALGVLQGRDITLSSRLIERLFGIVEDSRFMAGYRRIAAHIVLAKPTTGLRERLLAYRTSVDPVIKHALLFGLMKNGTKGDARLVVGYLDDPEGDVKNQAEYALRWITGVNLGNPREEGLDTVIAKRKAWWEQHKDDPEYR